MAKANFTNPAYKRAWLKRRAKEAAAKRSAAAKKGAATRKRNARKGVKQVDVTKHGVSFTPGERKAFTVSLDPNYWRTGVGIYTHVSDMSEEHLRNTVSYLARTQARALGVNPFLHTLQHTLAQFSALLAECKRRGIQV